MQRIIGLVAVIGLTLTAVTGCTGTSDIAPEDGGVASFLNEMDDEEFASFLMNQ